MSILSTGYTSQGILFAELIHDHIYSQNKSWDKAKLKF